MKWILKASVQKIIGLLPFSHRMNFYAQRYITVGKELPEKFVKDRLLVAKRHLENVFEYSRVPMEEIRLLEIGTGWYPIIPVVFFLSGVNDVMTIDVRRLYTRESLNETLRKCIKLCEDGTMKKMFPTYDPNRVDVLKRALEEKDNSAKLKWMNIRFERIDVTKDSNIQMRKDIVISNNTFQFIPAKKIKVFFDQLRKFKCKNTIYSLEIDLTDEFSHFDSSLSTFNFLRFSPFEWRLITGRLNRTNRLRFIDYQEQYASQFSVLKEEKIRGVANDLGSVPIHQSFAKYNHSDLYIKQGRVVLS